MRVCGSYHGAGSDHTVKTLLYGAFCVASYETSLLCANGCLSVDMSFEKPGIHHWQIDRIIVSIVVANYSCNRSVARPMYLIDKFCCVDPKSSRRLQSGPYLNG